MKSVTLCPLLAIVVGTNAFTLSRTSSPTTSLNGMERPILDSIATTIFRLENERVQASSELDDKGRLGEPMEWSESDSLVNQFSVAVASNTLGYQFKQWIADIVAGDFDAEETQQTIDQFTCSNQVAMFSFSTCPFCRRAKDILDEQGIDYQVMELDLMEGNEGNAIRAMLGKQTQRTSMPNIFIDGTSIGGCNDGTPGLVPLVESGELDQKISAKKNTLDVSGWLQKIGL